MARRTKRYIKGHGFGRADLASLGGLGHSIQRLCMYYETDKNNHGLPYNPLKACVVPRPIGWLTTISAAGVVNLAPFSFFNVLSYDPPFVLFSSGVHEEDGGKKDSVVNVETTGEFVYNMATWEQRGQMNQTAFIVERG